MACFDVETAMPVRPWTAVIGQDAVSFVPASGILERREKSSYLSGIDVAVVNAGDDKSLAGDVDALGVCLVNGGRLAPGDVGEVLHLLGADLFAIPCQLAAPSRMRSAEIGCEGDSSLVGGHDMASFQGMAG